MTIVKPYILWTDRGVALISSINDARFRGYWLSCPNPKVAVFPSRAAARALADKWMRNRIVSRTAVLELGMVR